MFGRKKGPTPSQMRAMQQEQMAMQRAKKLANEAAERASAKTAKEEKEYRDMQLREGVVPANVKPLSAKNAPPAPRPMEQVEINKAKQLADANANAPRMPAAGPMAPSGTNTVPNAQMAAMQKIPQPGTVPPANAMPMAPSNPGGASSGLGSGGPGGPSSGLGSGAQLGSQNIPVMKRGGKVRNKPAAKFSSGGSTSKASSRGDGIAQRGKTKGRYI
jgi:hypothetical protein